MLRLLTLALLLPFTCAQTRPQDAQNSFPHNYPGKPKGDFGTNWQKYYEVTDPLPGVDFSVSRSFAGNIPVNRANHPNSTLFFYAVEKQKGSLTNGKSEDPWIIWLNGGPGSSSLFGFFLENGPIRIASNYSMNPNPFSWNSLADTIWIDQPVGTGFSTTDDKGYVPNEDQMAEDFLQFLSNLVKIFPSLAKRPLYLTGESYAGTYIPYISKALFSSSQPPVTLKKIAIGDGTIGSIAETTDVPTVSVIETYPQLINFDQEVYEYFRSQAQLCGHDLNLTYPQQGLFPSIGDFDLLGSESVWRNRIDILSGKKILTSLIKDQPPATAKRQVIRRQSSQQSGGTLSGRTNGSIDQFYGCLSFNMLIDYAINFTAPWAGGSFDVYDVPDALSPEAPSDASKFLNNNQTRGALHAPTSKNWVESINYAFSATDMPDPSTNRNPFGDPSLEPMTFFPELLANASQRGVNVILYSGNDDVIVAHRATEVVIQNTTWGGIQGFSQKPSTPWFNDRNEFAGFVHQERNLTYVLFQGAGHMVPGLQAENALVFLRDFVLGSNTTGSLNSSSATSSQGAVPTLLADGVLPQYNAPIFFGAGTTAGSTVFPSGTIAAWESFMQTATTAASNPTKTGGTNAVTTSNVFTLATLLLSVLLL